MSEFAMFAGSGILQLLVDPNSTLGLRLEGSRARSAGEPADANPYTSWCPGSLAEGHWWEGWWLEGSRQDGAAKPDLKAAQKFAAQRKRERRGSAERVAAGSEGEAGAPGGLLNPNPNKSREAS